jgi:hypothetical protein
MDPGKQFKTRAGVHERAYHNLKRRPKTKQNYNFDSRTVTCISKLLEQPSAQPYERLKR